jgi:tetratricopeptide (TPR) repeat protein
MFVLSGLIIFLKGRLALVSRPIYGARLMLAGVIGGTILGMGAKENAVLLPLLALGIEYALFVNDRRQFASDRLLRRFYILILLLPATLCLAYLVIDPGLITSAYQYRSFSLFERLLTETRVLWFYLSLIFFPVATRFGLFHDDLPISTGLLTPPSTIVAIAGLMGILYFVFAKTKQFPVLVFAVTWFLAGHLLESSVLGLELVFEHRNYLPSIGIIFAAAYGLLRLSNPLSAEMKKTAGLLILAVVIAFGMTTWSRANTWKDISILAGKEVRYHPDSIRANDFAARVLASEGSIQSAIQYTVKGSALSSREAGFHIDLQILMAMLLPQIESELKRLPPDTWRAGALQIEGLPECIKAVKTRTGIHLVCETSSSEKILELLEQRPLSIHTSISLEELRRCLIDRNSICRFLEHDAVRWFAVAAENSRAPPGVKERILFSAALVHGHRQDYQLALDYLRRASELAPKRLAYRLGQVDYLIRLNRIDEAKALLKQTTIPRPSGDRETSLNEEAIQALWKVLSEQRQ